MSKNLVNKVSQSTQDNLTAKLFPPAETFGIKVAAKQGLVKRGTVLALTSQGKYVVLGSADSEGAEANCVLSDDVDATGNEDVTAVAYRTGHFNRNALILADGYTMTITDVEALRKNGILLSDMME